MKKLFLIITAVSFFAVSCELVDKLTQFDMDYDSSFTVNSGIPANIPFDIVTPVIQTNSESTFEEEKTAKNLIEEISLKELRLVITTPADANLDFLNKIELYIKADGMDEVMIAWADNIPAGTTDLNMEVESVNLKGFLLADEYQLRIKTTTDEPITKDIDIDIKSVFHVNASILGI